MPVRLLLNFSTLRGAHVLAGAGGLDRVVNRINMMTTPEIVPWVQENELLLTTSYPLPKAPDALSRLVTELDARGLAALGIKLGKYIDRIPEQVLRRADELGFPVLEIPHEVRFDDIVSEVLTDIAHRQTAVITRSEEIYRAFVQIVLYGGGLTEITVKLSELLGAAVIVVDADEHVLAETGLDGAAERLATGLIEGGRLRLDEGVRAGTWTVDGTRIEVFPVTAGSLHYGRIVVVERGRSLPDDTSLAMERAATVAALEMTKKLEVAAVERRYQSDFLRDLLLGRLDKPGDVERRCTLLGWDLGRPLAVIVGRLYDEPAGGSASEVERLRTRLSDLWVATVRSHDRSAAATAFGEEFVAVVGAGSQSGPPAALAAEIAAGMAVARRPLSYGVSRVVGGVAGLPEAYKQAGRAVEVGRQTSGPHEVTTFDSLGVLRLLSIIEDVDELRSFVDDTLGPVLSRGEEESRDLLNTLSVLLDCNLNAAAAAKELHFHYNTVRYRIAKLERLLGPFISNRHLSHRLWLALQIMQLRRLGSSSHGLTDGFGPD